MNNHFVFFELPVNIITKLIFFVSLVGCKIIKGMNYAISFQERVRLGLEQLSKQSPVTLTMARKQVQQLKNSSKSGTRKQRN